MALVETSHPQFVFSFVHLLLINISTSGSLSFSLSICTFFIHFFFILTFCNRFYQNFSWNPKNHSLPSLSLYFSQPFLLSGWNFPLPEAAYRPSDIRILPLVVMLVTTSNSSWGVQPLTCMLSAPLGSGTSPVCWSLRLPAKPSIKFELLLVSIRISYCTEIRRFRISMFSNSMGTTSKSRHHPIAPHRWPQTCLFSIKNIFVISSRNIILWYYL